MMRFLQRDAEKYHLALRDGISSEGTAVVLEDWLYEIRRSAGGLPMRSIVPLISMLEQRLEDTHCDMTNSLPAVSASFVALVVCLLRMGRSSGYQVAGVSVLRERSDLLQPEDHAAQTCLNGADPYQWALEDVYQALGLHPRLSRTFCVAL